MGMVQINADGECIQHDITGEPSLEMVQKIVGGYIEVVQVVFEGEVVQMIVNEDGLSMQLPENPLATMIFMESGRYLPQTIVGNVVVLTGDNKVS